MNVDLSALKGVHAPVMPSFLPLSAEALSLVLFILLLFLIAGFLGVLYHNSSRKYALRLLDFYEKLYKEDVFSFATQVSILLKRVALKKYKKQKIASLFGAEWVCFLNKKTDVFLPLEIEDVFTTAPYKKKIKQKGQEEKMKKLYDFTKRWIIKNTSVF